LQGGAYVGEVALVRDVRRTATIRAMTPTLVDTLSKQDFLRELATVPSLREAVEQSTAQRVGSASNTPGKVSSHV
jgi:CRP-like cAMP-binding protein